MASVITSTGCATLVACQIAVPIPCCAHALVGRGGPPSTGWLSSVQRPCHGIESLSRRTTIFFLSYPDARRHSMEGSCGKPVCVLPRSRHVRVATRAAHRDFCVMPGGASRRCARASRALVNDLGLQQFWRPSPTRHGLGASNADPATSLRRANLAAYLPGATTGATSVSLTCGASQQEPPRPRSRGLGPGLRPDGHGGPADVAQGGFRCV